MKAMVLNQIGNFSQNWTPLSTAVLISPEPAEGEILLEVSTCGVCHTVLDEIEGRTPPSSYLMILGNQVVGRQYPDRLARTGPRSLPARKALTRSSETVSLASWFISKTTWRSGIFFVNKFPMLTLGRWVPIVEGRRD